MNAAASAPTLALGRPGQPGGNAETASIPQASTVQDTPRIGRRSRCERLKSRRCISVAALVRVNGSQHAATRMDAFVKLTRKGKRIVGRERRERAVQGAKTISIRRTLGCFDSLLWLSVSVQQGMILKSSSLKLCSARASVSDLTNPLSDSAETIATNDLC
jgi:hypothetical protein